MLAERKADRLQVCLSGEKENLKGMELGGWMREILGECTPEHISTFQRPFNRSGKSTCRGLILNSLLLIVLLDTWTKGSLLIPPWDGISIRFKKSWRPILANINTYSTAVIITAVPDDGTCMHGGGVLRSPSRDYILKKYGQDDHQRSRRHLGDRCTSTLPLIARTPRPLYAVSNPRSSYCGRRSIVLAVDLITPLFLEMYRTALRFNADHVGFRYAISASRTQSGSQLTATRCTEPHHAASARWVATVGTYVIREMTAVPPMFQDVIELLNSTPQPPVELDGVQSQRQAISA
nr:hypothetical protein CFP56_24471 [Quercus suber]